MAYIQPIKAPYTNGSFQYFLLYICPRPGTKAYSNALLGSGLNSFSFTFGRGSDNLAEDNIYKSKIIKDIDSNIGQLLKTDAKFYAIHVSPSEKELRTMGNTEQEQAESMKQYIRKVFISEYAKNFNKELSALDIKFYGKIHFDRSRSDNELNMHCHLIVSRKDQTNKKKLSPLTNHKNTANGIIKGGFNRMNLFQQVEQGFDKLFSYNRQLSQSFEYSNTMKNGSIDDKLKMQEQKLKEPKQYFTAEKKKEIFQSNEKENIISCDLDSKADNKQSYNQQNNSGGDSLLFILSLCLCVIPLLMLHRNYCHLSMRG